MIIKTNSPLFVISNILRLASVFSTIKADLELSLLTIFLNSVSEPNVVYSLLIIVDFEPFTGISYNYFYRNYLQLKNRKLHHLTQEGVSVVHFVQNK